MPRFASTLLILALLSACGQTGPLYMPGEKPPPSAAANVNTSDVEASDETADDMEAALSEEAPESQE